MPRKILVALDDQHLVGLLQKDLEKQGYQVFAAFDGTQALNQVHREVPDYLVLDPVISNGDGIQICQHLKEDPRLASIAIIILTGSAPESTEWLSYVKGDAYVPKREAETILRTS